MVYYFGMETERMSIGKLADLAGVSRRTIRFYVQRGLLDAPRGRGRGSDYDRTHLERLERIRELQQAGHSLDAIDVILDGNSAPPRPDPAAPIPRSPARLKARLWTRLRLGDGVELHLDMSRHNPDVEQLMAVRQTVRDILGLSDAADTDAASDHEP